MYESGEGEHHGPVILIGRDKAEELFNPLVLSFGESISLGVIGH